LSRIRTFAKSRPAVSTAALTAIGRQITACFLGALLCALAVSVVRADEAAPTISPAKALQRLLDGNRRYASDRAERPHQRPSDAPQHPLAAILSCSDSRVPPEIIFDQGVGSLFVVRAAGNTYDRLALQSIEYAVGHLGTALIIVIGHDQCGAVTAAVKAYPDPRAGPMLANIYPAVSEARGQKGDELSNAIDDNAALIAKRLEHEPEFAKKIASGQLKIHPARYSLKTGRVRLLK
jgi:carbonic anhydrase